MWCSGTSSAVFQYHCPPLVVLLQAKIQSTKPQQSNLGSNKTLDVLVI